MFLPYSFWTLGASVFVFLGEIDIGGLANGLFALGLFLLESNKISLLLAEKQKTIIE